MKSYLAKMRGARASRRDIDWHDAAWSWLGAFIGMGAVTMLGERWLTEQLLVVGSFGATSVLLYAAPESPFAQPRNVLLGSLLSAWSASPASNGSAPRRWPWHWPSRYRSW